jgi:NADPH-dependent 2,4-dienoyl-CoA reductase/sulfur reductase-like enzyme
MRVVIIGNGISGITAARCIRKFSDHEIIVISAESDQFFSRTALMYVYMGHMRFKDIRPYPPGFWKKNEIQIFHAFVSRIDFSKKILFLKEVIGSRQFKVDFPEQLRYDRLILAVGSAPNKFGWPGQDLERVQGLYTLQDLESMETHSKNLDRAVIVGGGLIGVEMAEMFHSRNIPVTFLVREENFWDIVLPKPEAQLIGAHIKEHGIELLLSTELQEIKGNDRGQSVSVITSNSEEIPCQFVGLTAGVHPNINWLTKTPLETDRGVLVNEYLETSIEDVYAIGDCAQMRNPKPGRSAIEAVWYTGRMMGEAVAQTICGERLTYDPGIWFNSAKFFDIEYQVYGTILPNPDETYGSHYWESGNKKKSLRIAYDSRDKSVIGFNLLGIRFRHEVCEKWIRDGTTLDHVLSNLSLANFDPEFSRQYEKEIVQKFRQSNLNTINGLTRKWNAVHRFLNPKHDS